MAWSDKLADFLRLNDGEQAYTGYPQMQVGLNKPRQAGYATGFLEGATGADSMQPKNPITDPNYDQYAQGKNIGEAVGIGAMALPAYAMALRAGAPKAYNALENYMVKSGGMIPLEAYHGTPHTINGKFDINKVGTGEGAQVYGHGMYFAENPKVAESYKGLDPAGGATPSVRRTLNGQELEAGTPEYHAGTLLSRNGVTLKSAKDMVKSWIDDPNALSAGEKTVEGWKKTLDTLNSINKKSAFKELPHEGNLYKVDIPDEYIPTMMEWDKPLGQQSSFVKKAVNSLKKHITPEMRDELGGNLDLLFGKDVTPAQFLNTWEIIHPESKIGIGEQLLNEAGVKGVRYLDNFSRDAGKGTSNFVVFEPSEVKILEKNGVPTRKEMLEQLIDQKK